MNKKRNLLSVMVEFFAIMVALQGMRIGAKALLVLAFPALPEKMQTMCTMIALWLLCLLYIRLRHVTFPVFPKPFSRVYIIITVIAAALLIATPSNYIVGIPAVFELIYGSVVTPVFEETVFRGYMWERLRTRMNGKAVWLITALLFGLWHLGYMLPQMLAGNWFAVTTKLAAGLVYGTILGFVRLKSKSLYLSVVVHGVMNIFMF